MTTPLQKAALAVIDKWTHSHPLKECAVLELRKALDAETAQVVGPVAWMTQDGVACIPLYLHPPQPQAATPVPEGYVLVPIEPTDAMIKAADDGDKEYSLRSFGPTIIVQQGAYDHYCAMIRAAQGEKL